MFILVAACLMVPHAMASPAGIILIPKVFPGAVRTSGLSISYAPGVTIFGGTAPFVATALIAITDSRLAPAIYVTIVAVAALVVSLLTPETAGRAFRGGPMPRTGLRSPNAGKSAVAEA